MKIVTHNDHVMFTEIELDEHCKAVIHYQPEVTISLISVYLSRGKIEEIKNGMSIIMGEMIWSRFPNITNVNQKICIKLCDIDNDTFVRLDYCRELNR